MLLVRLPEHLASFRDRLVVRRHQLRRRAKRLLVDIGFARRRIQLQIVLVHDEPDPSRDGRDEMGEPAERHGLLVRLPIVPAFRDPLQHAPGPGRFTLQLFQDPVRGLRFRRFH